MHSGAHARDHATARTRGNAPFRLLILLAILSILAAGAYSRKHALVAEAKHLLRSARQALSSNTPGAAPASAGSLRPFIQHSVDTVVVDMHPGRTLPAGFFGINYSAFWDPAQGSAASARAFAQTPIRTVRFAGGVPADWYDWQDPYRDRWSSTSPLDLWRYAQKFGAAALYQTNYQGNRPNPPGQGYTVNSPENAAAWVAYNRSHGISAMMEVGNEEDMHMKDVHDSMFRPYIDAFNAQARAMHGADSSTKVIGPAGTNEYQWWNRDSLGMFLAATGNRTGSGQVDAISVHFYKGSTWYDAREVAQYWLSPDGPWAAIQQKIKAGDTRQLPVYITEWNLGASDSNNAFNPTAGHALAVADMLGAFAQSGVAGEDYFQIHGAGGWGLLYGSNESRPLDSATPAYYAMALWGHMGNRMLTLRQSDDPGKAMSTYATTKADGSVQLLAINKQAAPHRVRITLNGASARGHHLRIYTLAAAGGSAVDRDAIYDGVKMPSPQQPLPGPRDGGLVHGSVLEYTVPPYAAVVLDLDGSSPGPTLTARQISALLAAAAAHTAPFPPLVVSAQGRITQATVDAGKTQTLSATVGSNYDIGDVLVDLEVYDSAGKKVFQYSQNVTLRAGVAARLSRSYPLVKWATGGTYTYKIGVFGLNWAPSYTWNDHAATFTVAGTSQPLVVTAVGSVSMQSLKAGQAETLGATVGSNYDIGDVLVDLEVYDSAGKKVFQQAPTITLRGGTPARISATYNVPRALPGGTYIYKIGVFGPGWSPLYLWNDHGGTFSVETAP